MAHPHPTGQIVPNPTGRVVPHPTGQNIPHPTGRVVPHPTGQSVSIPTGQIIPNPKLHIDEYGWTAVPLDHSNFPSAETIGPLPSSINFVYPETLLAKRLTDRVLLNLPRMTVDHISRVYYYAFAIVATHFPEWIGGGGLKSPFLETLFLACLYHDIAVVEKTRATSNMSFEFLGGIIALQDMMGHGAPRAQAESVCEALVRLRLNSTSGSLSRLGQLVRLATGLGECAKVLLANLANQFALYSLLFSLAP
jgi:cyanamide hydratase